MARNNLNSVLTIRRNGSDDAEATTTVAEHGQPGVSGVQKPAEQQSTTAEKSEQTPFERSAEAPAAREKGSEAPVKGAAPAKSSRRKPIFMGLGAVALLAAAYFAYQYITVGRFMISTDDAYVGAYMSIISPKVSAIVTEVPVVDNEAVKEGQVLVHLDEGDYQLALDQAQSKLATQMAVIKTFDAQIKAAEANAAQERAQLDAAKANVIKTKADYERTQALTAKDYATQAALDAAVASRDSAIAQVNANEAAIQSADANVALLHAQRIQAEKTAKELQVAVDQAKRDLSFTTIRAPFDGVIGNRGGVQVGDYVTPGKRLMAVVPLDKVFVDANYKETQLPPIAAGQTATISVDALDGEDLKGTVQSVSPASGSQFSLLPPENATGNFTKIVQRVPVRIAIPASEARGRLRPGLSVVVSIDTRTTPKTEKTAQK
ncbi:MULTISPECIES: HlyD family secretion protein [unclassified Hyphomicrobium]|uniref:HlyD family secretion protein n=1 Tax=unclassified Hyphomicrobium TaxID=2619925 RepID=UPI000213E3BC|nr:MULTISPECIES: HlyD family secretion protein [unclassified Hyphomicrobium]CCB64618.1 putative multidrug resistance secretion protein (emrA-like) [Hyphomicrobium sp. MC1]